MSRPPNCAAAMRIAVAALLLLSAVGCEPKDSAPAKACDLLPYRPDSPHISTHEAWRGKVVIVGHVFVVCDAPPEEHELRVWLERVIDGQRIVMATDVFRRPPGRFGDRYTVAFVGCEPGDWLSRARAQGSLRGKPFTFEDKSRSRTISADDCRRARQAR